MANDESKDEGVSEKAEASAPQAPAEASADALEPVSESTDAAPRSEPPKAEAESKDAAPESEPPKVAATPKSEPPKAGSKGAAPKSEPPKAAIAARETGAHAAHHDDHHGLAHVASLKMLVGVWGGLMVLTVLTVSVTSIDLGAQLNLAVAMIIATIKAVMVMAFFMHLLWDKKFNVLVFLSSVLFVVLFITLTIQDRNEYQPDIEAQRAAEAAAAALAAQ